MSELITVQKIGKNLWEVRRAGKHIGSFKTQLKAIEKADSLRQEGDTLKAI